MARALTVTAFSVRATERQSVRWKQAAESEGHASAGTWLAAAADAYLKIRARAGQPVPLAWRRGRFPVELEGGITLTLPGFLSPPYGAFRGTAEGPGVRACGRYTLVFLPARQVIATMRTIRQCKTLASELAAAQLRDDLKAAIVERHRREAV